MTGDDVEASVRAAAALYAAGHHHAAHDPMEAVWLDLPDGDDERLLHGLIQLTAAVHHGDEGNWSAVASLAASAGGYLADLPATHRGVDLDPVRAGLAAMAADPVALERSGPPPLRYRGRTPRLGSLDLDAALLAAEPLAEALGHDPDPVAAAVEYARADRDTGEDRFVALVRDYVREGGPGIVHQRLSEHVSRRQSREEDVEGLFD